MKIIEELKRRSEIAIDDVKIDLKLYNLADDLEKKARVHLKRIITVLSEFDIHDEKHSERVIYNIEQLLGDETIVRLSSYELFLLHLSSFFHDCAMAPSDWEINTLKLTEGTEKYNSNATSIKFDLKPPFKLSSAINLIEERKQELYRQFEGDVKDWMFSPANESTLKNYLAELLIDYQNYRNGFADQLKKVNNQSEYNDLNEFIRIDYIRATHHIRIEIYLKNLESLFSKAFEQPAWGKKLAHDLARICRSHGEDISFIKDFSVNSQYYGSESANLQLVAIMLRLGDIIHFSFDRAPIDLRSSRLFKSEYSFQQWAIKNSGANYSIENGKISFRAYCEIPDTYFKLHQYIDWIEIEIQNYFKFQRQWNKSYINNLQDKVDRTNINNDTDNFLAKRGLSFSLNQKKILELLMGVGLYKDKFACLRELYQNSLDACRCMLSFSNVLNTSTKGIIEFYIQKDAEKVFLCCKDNGVGMSKEVIEKYLLKIGNSYYKSSDFFRQQATWGGEFTPTSQFGIGILSCFMIGDRIEITTKINNEDYVSCSIDGPHENFYYKTTSPLEMEKIPFSGTLVKILLNDETKNVLQNSSIEKLGLLLLGIEQRLPKKFLKYLNYQKKWENHLYRKINNFVDLIPEDIEVEICLEDSTVLQLLPKPIILDSRDKRLGIDEADFEFVDYLNNHRRFYPLKQKFSEIRDFLETYLIKVSKNSVEYVTTLTLPKKPFSFDEIQTLYSVPEIRGHGICIDGIGVQKDSISVENYYSSALIRIGIMNFTGELRPQLSVDRTSTITYPSECEIVATELAELLLKEILNKTKEHIAKYKLEQNGKEVELIWKYIFEKIGFADTLFINELSLTEYGNIYWKPLENTINDHFSVRQFITSKKILIGSYNIRELDILTKKLILTKLISATRISINNSSVSLESEGLLKTNLIQKKYSFSEFDLLINADDWNVSNYDYDIITSLYPLIPTKLFNLLDKLHVQEINNKIKIIHSFSNGLTAFFNQSPLLINENLGLYIEEKNWGESKNSVYNFENKRAKINLFELNERYRKVLNEERYVLVVFISPVALNSQEQEQLKKIKDPSYIKGVQEGWSLLITSMDKENIVIIPGECSRDQLVAKLSNSFWEEYKEITFKFTDGPVMEKIAGYSENI